MAPTEEARADPTFEELSATIARYDDPDDKLTIALGNFNRVRAERDRLAAEVVAQRDVVAAAQEYETCADWYRRCLEDVVDRRPVRGLSEAKAGFDSARDKFNSAVAAVVSGTPERQHPEGCDCLICDPDPPELTRL